MSNQKRPVVSAFLVDGGPSWNKWQRRERLVRTGYSRETSVWRISEPKKNEDIELRMSPVTEADHPTEKIRAGGGADFLCHVIVAKNVTRRRFSQFCEITRRQFSRVKSGPPTRRSQKAGGGRRLKQLDRGNWYSRGKGNKLHPCSWRKSKTSFRYYGIGRRRTKGRATGSARIE